MKKLLTEPRLYSGLHDDYAPSPEDWEATDHPMVSYCLLTENDGEILGIIIVNMHSTIQWEIHNAILPHVGWKKRLVIAREFFAWLWKAGCLRVIGKVVASNRYALKFNEAIGMHRFGVNEKSFMKGGVLQDEVWFGISAPGCK